MAVPWEVYINRRKLNPVKLCRSHQIQNYAGLVAYCSGHHITPPPEEKAKDYFETTKKARKTGRPKPPRAAPKTAPTPVDSTKKTTRRRSTKKTDTSSAVKK